ncbi:glycosyltransferase family protein [Xanthomonas phaseoli]|uniref:glycosyltransferase family protein n=1 Tax=Xanthomonas phaseoli TaxID=1985254 RepID=UPI001E470F3E|nr:glycosyltransferase [Xanthomonas phaseoli]
MKQWRVLILDTKRSNPNHYICLAMARALSEAGAVECVVRADYADAVLAAQRSACNLFIAFDGEELDRPIVERIAQICGLSVLWVTEDPYERSINIANADLFDLIFTNDPGSVSGYGSKGVSLPLAADPRFHFHSIPDDHDDTHYLYDLFFAGTAWPNRSEFLARLQSAIPEINLKLALPANPYIPAPKLGMDPSAYDWRTPNTEFARFANRSRSVLTLHRSFSSSGNDPVAHTPGPRFFEVALAGGFQLVDISIPEIRVQDYYQEGRDYVGFDGPADCIEKLRYYLAHPEQRMAIARSAQAVTLKQHLYLNRVEYLLSCVDALQREPESIVKNEKDSPLTRRKVLVVSHNIIGVAPYGGVEVYQESVRQALADDIEFLFYTPDRSVQPSGRRYTLRNEALDVVETFDFDGGLDEAALTCPQREEAFSGLLYKYGIELVHFQHLIGHPPSIGLLPAALGLRCLFSLHDYHAVCSRFNLLDYREVYCNIPSLPIETCDVCLNASRGADIGSQARRRAFFSRVLDRMDVLHVNTPGVAALYQRMYPGLSDSGRLLVNAVPMPKNDEISAVPLPKLREGKLRIAIPGNFTRNKGGNELIHVINQLRYDEVEISIVGPVPAEYQTILDILKIPNLTLHGAYKPGTLKQILAGHDLSIHFSIWPETYCISLSEAWSAGVVPIVSDIGALGERVIDGENGYVIPVSEAGSMVCLIRQLIADRSGLEAIRARVLATTTQHHDEHMRWLRNLYAKLLPLQPFVQRTQNYPRGNTIRDLGILLVEPNWVIPPRAASVADGGSGPIPVFPLGIVGRGYRFYKKNGLGNTIARVLQGIARRLGGVRT